MSKLRAYYFALEWPATGEVMDVTAIAEDTEKARQVMLDSMDEDDVEPALYQQAKTVAPYYSEPFTTPFALWHNN